jgi:NH3-dependent NAD+ synthetase
MFKRWLGGKIEKHEEVAQVLARLTEKFSGADVRSMVKQALAKAGHSQSDLTLEILKAEVERKRMRTIALYDEFQELRRWGRMYCDPAGPVDN